VLNTWIHYHRWCLGIKQAIEQQDPQLCSVKKRYIVINIIILYYLFTGMRKGHYLHYSDNYILRETQIP